MLRSVVCAFGVLFVLVSSRHPGDTTPMATPPIDLTSPVPAADGIEDITPPVPSQEACTLSATPHVPSITAEQPSFAGAAGTQHSAIPPARFGPTTPGHSSRRSLSHLPRGHPGHRIRQGPQPGYIGHIVAPLSTFGCSTHLYVQQPRPPCPTCRHAWNETSDRSFLNQRQHHGVDLPDRPLPQDTQAPARLLPSSPPHIQPHRLLPTSVSGRSFQAPRRPRVLPPETNKRGHGSRNGSASGATKSWALSIRCTKASHNAQLARSMVPGFSTSTSAPTHAGGSARTHTPHAGGRQYQYTPHSRPPPPNTLHRATLNTQLPTTTGQPVARRHLANRLRQPTVEFYVALLLAGARSLHSSAAAAAWQNVPATGTTWHTWARTLQNTEPIPWQQLHHIITTLHRVAAASGQRLPQHEAALPDRLHTAGRQQPTGTLVHFPWAVSFFQQADGYIPATAQETLLQAYLGERQASAVATLAQRWATHLHPAPGNSVAAEPPQPPVSEPQLNPRLAAGSHDNDPADTSTDTSASSSSSACSLLVSQQSLKRSWVTFLMTSGRMRLST